MLIKTCCYFLTDLLKVLMYFRYAKLKVIQLISFYMTILITANMPIYPIVYNEAFDLKMGLKSQALGAFPKLKRS